MEANTALTALDQLKDWSTWLVGIQTGALGLIAVIANPKSTFTYGGRGAKWTVVCLGLSTFFATWVLAAIPSITLRVKPTDNIYSISVFEWLPIPLWGFTAAQHWFTMAGILVFIFTYSSKEKASS
ncbi:MAG TPA: hypothetical protein VN643_10985 [Pyrinomonadaceae bacterium]|nr:hypothetical protein [Pyrinomonadaceae bacterium]